ncbi:intracellular protein transport protein USO1-like [Telopea speciosissima]|uniref:intracellular protein transport protein USO1-like n=1 Tax=Telopea speciosissima TaxID=54955 RepID=UPI001CC3C8F7|nr:intracellular protein transport protein USO1-like [Telopea speciosissima]
MAFGEGSLGKTPHFDGTNYAFWKNRMETYLGSLGYDVWASVLNEYSMTGVAPTDNQEKKKYENNSRAMHAIKDALIDSEFVKVMECKSAKQLWDKLKSIHEGDAKIKEAKLQVYRAQFEGLKMLNEENVEDYMLRVNGVVNSIRGLRESLTDSVVVKKILRSLPDRLDSKVSAVEEAKDLEVLSLDELHGIFTAYEMRKGKGKSVDKEAAFKAMNKLKITEQPESEEEDSDDDDESNNTSEEEAEDESDDDVDDHAIFMMFEEKEDESPRTCTTSEDEEEGEVNFEEEFRAALKELKKERKKVKQVSQNLKEQEQSVLQLKKQADESKKILEDLEEKLSQKTIECTKLESKNLSLKAKLEEESNILAKYSDFQKEIDALKAKVAEFEKDSGMQDIETSSQVHLNSKKLDEILSSQRSTHNKFGLGFVGESSKSAKGKEKAQHRILLL